MSGLRRTVHTHATHHISSSSSSNGPVFTPSSSDTAVSQPPTAQDLSERMEAAQGQPQSDHAEHPPRDDTQHEGPIDLEDPVKDAAQSTEAAETKTDRKEGRKNKKSKSKKSRKGRHRSHSPDDSSETEDVDASDSSSSSSDESSSEEVKPKSKGRRRRDGRRNGKSRRSRRKHYPSSSSDSEDSETSDEGSDESEYDDEPSRRRRKGKGRQSRRDIDEEDELDEDDAGEDVISRLRAKSMQDFARLQAQNPGVQLNTPGINRQLMPPPGYSNYRQLGGLGLPDQLAGRRAAGIGSKKGKAKASKKKRRAGKRSGKLDYKRVDQLWDSTIHNYKLTETAEDQEDEFSDCVFHVRRKFDWENKYKHTVVDIKSKYLRDSLKEVMKDAKSVSLVEDQPVIDPNMLFLYLEEIRTHVKKTLKDRLQKEKKRKMQRRIKRMRAECKLLVKYLDKDYAETKRSLYPMLAAGNITFDLIWALFKPNTLAFTTTYGAHDEPRAFKVDYANKNSSFMRGEWYSVEGQYLEYDGKQYGLGDFESEIEAFKGPRKITSLTTYPLKYHKDAEGVKKQLIERGKHFVSMQGMNYRFHKGLAFVKKKRNVAKININGRVMVDPALFRRVNPNYPISLITRKDPDELPGQDSDDESEGCCCSDDDDDNEGGEEGQKPTREFKYKVIVDKDKKPHLVQVPVDEDGKELRVENMEQLAEGAESSHDFTEEELLIASPVVLGFAFSEKLWLELSLSGLHEIEWNEGAFDSLVLPDDRKSIVKGLVETHKFHPAETIDDVVQGKGQGLVAVLHGPPGTGKTLTAEGIAELLKCPLYMVSAGELGTDPRNLEAELQRILDIAHAWGAVLLLDEADVFLERREVHDIHRNALVSIFLRLLEYFKGILFLTTNRVNTFDDAFQSRIHIALRYGELSSQAKKSIWNTFLGKVAKLSEEEDSTPLVTDNDLDTLARKNLNGRQIKNAVRTAQALAVSLKERLSITHIKRVLDVAESFEKDLKGGSGYDDAMRSYT